MAKKRLEVVIAGDAKGARRAFDQTEKRAGGFSSKMAGIGKKVGKALAVGIGGAVLGAAALIKGGLDEIMQNEKIDAQTAAVLKSTGAAANVTAGQIRDYAAAIEKRTGVEAEGIKQGANMLATFTDIRNEVGKGNDIFNQATSIITDMSVALGTDAKKSAIQVGKALNDPIKGVTALTKVGVSFTQQQKDQIKWLTMSGDKLGAQKIILKELNKEFGGSADAFGKTTAGKVSKLKIMFEDFQAAVAAKVLPVLTKLGDWLADKIPKATLKVQAIFKSLQPRLAMVGEKLKGVGDALRPVVEAIGRFVKSNPKPVLAGLAVVIGVALVGALWSMAAAMAAAFAPVYLVVGAVALLVGGLVLAYQKVGWFHTAVDAVARFMVDKVLPVIKAVAAWIVGTLVPAIGTVVRWIADRLVPGFQLLWSFITTYVVPIVAALAKSFVDTAVMIGQKVGDIVSFIVGLPGRIVGTISTLWNDLRAGASIAKQWVVDRFTDMVTFITSLPTRVSTAALGMFDGLKDAFRNAINWVIRKWNDLELKLPSVSTPFGDVGSYTISTPNIPEFHTGGTFRSPNPGGVGLAMLRDGERVTTPTSRATTPGASAGGGTTVVNNNYVTVHNAGSTIAARDLVDTIHNGLEAKQRRTGRRLLAYS